MKKIIAICLILVIGLFILSGCSSNDTESEEQGGDDVSPEPTQNQESGGSRTPTPPALPGE